MKRHLPAGIPGIEHYMANLESADFTEMENFSDRFISSNDDILKEYARKWVKDPLHQWSRLWEYPFVFSRIRAHLERHKQPSVLDAGSGVTFFPYYIKSKYPLVNMSCGDCDESHSETFLRLNRRIGLEIDFQCFDLKKIPFNDHRFDVVYCISVLEHTNEFRNIIEQFYRVIKNGGKLILTFDVSLDGSEDIDPERGNELLKKLTEVFTCDDELEIDLLSQLDRPGLFSTQYAKTLDLKLLPWKRPSLLRQMKSFLSGHPSLQWPPPLTVFCLSLTKRSNNAQSG